MREFGLPTTFQRLLRRARRPWARHVARKELGHHIAFAECLLAQLARDGQIGQIAAAPRIMSALVTRSDVVVAKISTSGTHDTSLVLKLPLTSHAKRSIIIHRQVLMALCHMPELQSFCTFLPRAITWGDCEGRSYYLETALEGVGAGDLVRQQAEPAEMKQDAARLIGQLHMGTSKRRVVDEAIFTQLAGDDLALLHQLAEHWPETAVLCQKLKKLEDLLRDQIYGQELSFSWTHGDFWPGNLLMQPANGAINGIIDWDRASPDQIPLHDILHLLAYTRKMQRRTELGEEVLTYLLPSAFDVSERVLISEAMEQLRLPVGTKFFQAATFLYWLHFVAANLSRYPTFQNDARWLKDNVFLVLKRGVV